MKKFYLILFLFLTTHFAKSQAVLTINGASAGTPTLYISNGVYLNVSGGININQAGSGSGSDYILNNGTIRIISDGATGQSDFNNAVSGLKVFSAGQTTGTVIFAADNETQFITGGGTSEFMNLAVNNYSSPLVKLSQDVVVNGVLNIGGVIDIQANNLTLLSSGVLGNPPFSASNMIQADGTGQFIREVKTGNHAYVFPVGDGAPVYSPVTLTFVTSASSGTVGINVKPVMHPQMNNPTNASNYIKRYWTFQNTGLTTYSYTGVFEYNNADIVGSETRLRLSRWNNPWYIHNSSFAKNDSLIVVNPLDESIAPLSGDFTGRNSECATSVAVSAIRDTICSGTIAHLAVTGNSGTIQWQSSSSGAGFNDINGATAASYGPIVSQDTYFRVWTSNGNCSDTSSAFKLFVKPSPIVDFTTSGLALEVTFNSTGSDINIYSWDFGDGTTSSLPNPVHTYSKIGSYQVCLTVLNGTNCSFVTCHNVDVLTGINSVSNENRFAIYPNPFTNAFFIENPDANSKIKSIEVFNVLGEMVFDRSYGLQSDKIQIDLSALSNSIYYIRIRTDEGNYFHSLIKQ